ncbi:MAG: hypothetical protein H7225_04000 [Massilia sp.]|nr:hypothetical protein [Aquabacterium sp.]
MASRLRRVAAWAALAPLAFILAAPDQAQSRYAMTPLKPPFLGVTDHNLFIDAQDRVLGFAGYFKSAGYALDPSSSGKWVWVTTYNSYISTWPATTAASVSSAKLFPNVWQTLPIDDVSPDGSKVLVKQVNYQPIVYDAASKQAVAYPGGGLQEPPLGERSSANAVNGKGWSAGFAQLVATQQNGEALYSMQAMR